MNNPRLLLVWAFLLDSLGQVLILALILALPNFIGIAVGGDSLQGQWPVGVLSSCSIPCLAGSLEVHVVHINREVALPGTSSAAFVAYSSVHFDCGVNRALVD